MAGALLVDKPQGPTSHDVVAFVRRTLQISRVGHTGTLDPLATGLLLVLVGPATRLAQFLATDEKEYVADVRLGLATPTYDAASLPPGVRYPIPDIRYPAREEIDAVLARFRGSFLQTPPAYSAKKIAGVAAYDLARRNETVELKPVAVTVAALDRLDTPDATLVRLRVAASAGFYVRSLAHDIGQALGCGAHLEALRRTRVGRFRVEDAQTLDVLERAGAALLPVSSLLGHMPAVILTEESARRATHGNPVPTPEKGDSPLFLARLVGEDGRVVAVAEARADGLLHPVVVLG
jgi:tRNA pseudouridine55 synthase